MVAAHVRDCCDQFVVTWVEFVQALYEYLDDTPLPAVFSLDEARHLKGRGAAGVSEAYTHPSDQAYKCLKALLGTTPLRR